jgi:predicted PurR-regulated permease PerM
MGKGDNFNKFAILVIVLVIVAAVYLTKPFFSILIFSFFVSYLLVPLYYYIENRIKHRSIAAGVTVLILLAASLLIILRIVYIVVAELSTLLKSPEDMQKIIQDLIKGLAKMIELILPINLSTSGVLDRVNQLVPVLMSTLLPTKEQLVTFITVSLPFYILAFIVVLVFSYYFLLAGNNLINQLFNFVPERKKEETRIFLKELDLVYSGLFRQHFIASIIMGIMSFFGFYLLGVPFPGLFGILVFLFSLYPLIGLAGVYIPLTAYYTYLQEYTKALVVLIFIFAINGVHDYYLRPKLVAGKGHVNPVITILAFGAPLLVLGIKGLVLGPAVYGFLLAFYRIKLREEEEKKEEEKKQNKSPEKEQYLKSSQNKKT